MKNKNINYLPAKISARRGILLPVVVFTILGVMAALPLLIEMSETTFQRTQYSEEWSRIQWAIEGANQKQLQSAPVVLDPYSGVVTTVATFSYPEGSGHFDVAVSISEGRTLLGRHRQLFARARAYRNGVDAGYDLDNLAAATVSVPGVAAGGEHTLIWKKDGSLYACGRNNYGQLGLDTISDNSTPAQTLKGACPATDAYYPHGWMVSAGGAHTLALDYYGGVYSWGRNNLGQLGHSSIGASSYVDIPQTVIYGGAHLQEASDLAAGKEFSLALRNNGQLLAWGSDSRGQLGYNPYTGIFTTPPSYMGAPQTVVSLSGSGSLQNIVGIAAGAEHALAIDRAGNIYGWGDNSYNQLGAAFTGDYSRKPINVNNTIATWVAQIEASGDKTSPATTQFNISVSHFIGSFSVEVNAPYKSDTYDYDVIRLTHTNGTEIDIRPTSQTKLESKRYRWTYDKNDTGTAYSLLTPGTYTVTLVNRDLFIFWWLENSLNSTWYKNNASGQENRGVYSFFGKAIDEPTNFFGIAAGGEFSMAVARDGTATKLYTWGRNNYGQLGHGDTSQRNRMAAIENFPPTGEKIRTLCAGKEHAMALTESGKVYTWGRNNYGQLGLNNTTDRSTPVRVTATIGSLNITSISAGNYHSLATDEDGNVYAWGLQTYGRLGNAASTGNRLIPVQITGFP
ncbi:MAG: hypothetical protein PHV05_11235 [Candidatus Riflebacteria bacterium]|nr:hypothetical protein [Candidatus Riflebacteria bacterium]